MTWRRNLAAIFPLAAHSSGMDTQAGGEKKQGINTVCLVFLMNYGPQEDTSALVLAPKGRALSYVLFWLQGE